MMLRTLLSAPIFSLVRTFVVAGPRQGKREARRCIASRFPRTTPPPFWQCPPRGSVRLVLPFPAARLQRGRFAPTTDVCFDGPDRFQKCVRTAVFKALPRRSNEVPSARRQNKEQLLDVPSHNGEGLDFIAVSLASTFRLSRIKYIVKTVFPRGNGTPAPPTPWAGFAFPVLFPSRSSAFGAGGCQHHLSPRLSHVCSRSIYNPPCHPSEPFSRCSSISSLWSVSTACIPIIFRFCSTSGPIGPRVPAARVPPPLRPPSPRSGSSGPPSRTSTRARWRRTAPVA